MVQIKFAIQNKLTGKILSKEWINSSYTEDDGYCHDTSEYNIEDSGTQGHWTTEYLLHALILISDFKYHISESLPHIVNRNKNLRVVAIHSFNGIDAIQIEGIPQKAAKFINEEMIAKACFTTNDNVFDNVSYENHKMSNNTINRTIALDSIIAFKLNEMLKDNKEIKACKPNIAFIVELCNETINKSKNI